MATLAQDNDTKAQAAKPPISTHRAFPFIVALWFAALLGMGSMVVPVEVIERLVVASGISAIVPQTAPPLGFTARALIALVFTAIGAAAGLFIARQVAKAHKGDMGPGRRRPIAAHDELGDDGFDGVPRRGRRALAIEEESTRSELLDLVPLPGVDSALRYEPASDLTDEAGETFDLTEEHLDDQDSDSTEAEIVPGFDMLSPAEQASAEEHNAPPAERQVFQLSDVQSDETIAEDGEFDDAWVEDTEEPQEQAAEPAPEGETFDFSAPAAAQNFAFGESSQADSPAFATDNQTTDSFEDEPEMTDETAAFDEDTAQDANQAEWQAAPLEELGLVQLAQRLGASIEARREKRRARAMLAASTAHTPRAVPAEMEMAPADEAAQAMAAYFGKPDSAAKAQDEQMPAAEELHDAAADFGAEDDQGDPFAAPRAEPEQTQFAPEIEPEIANPAAEEPSFALPRRREVPEAERQVFQPLSEDSPEARAPYQAETAFSHLSLPAEDEEEDEDMVDLAASFSLPLGRNQEAAAAAPQPAPAPQALPEEDELPAEDESEQFGSLLGMGNPFRKNAEEFVRIEDEPDMEEGLAQPAVVFPNEARRFERPSDDQPSGFTADNPQDAEENERALREALLNLQRMSGAG